MQVIAKCLHFVMSYMKQKEHKQTPDLGSNSHIASISGGSDGEKRGQGSHGS